ncbi:hypothetical protein ABPG72_016627 [Tetrahymena utriculariae]
MEKIREKRINEELNNLERAKITKKLPQNIFYQLIEKDGVLDDYKILVSFKGRQETIWQNYEIKGILSFPADFPIEPPSFQFIENFQHIHVYSNGVICLPLITKDFWNTKTTVLNVIIQIEDLIHRPPNLASPANHLLSELYQNSIEQYENFIRNMYKDDNFPQENF